MQEEKPLIATSLSRCPLSLVVSAVALCVCALGWGCPYCSLSVETDILRGAKCSQYFNGGARCFTDAECGAGRCSLGKCVCNAGYGCQRCGANVTDLIAGNTCSLTHRSFVLCYCFTAHATS